MGGLLAGESVETCLVCVCVCVVDERVSRCFYLSFRYVGVISPAESTGSVYIEYR